MKDSPERYVRLFLRDDGMVGLDSRLDGKGGEVVKRALDAACAELDRRLGPVPGGSDAATPEAARRRADALALVVHRALEVGFDPGIVARFRSDRAEEREDRPLQGRENGR